jgi:hypothetical protein
MAITLAVTLSGSISQKHQMRTVIEAALPQAMLFEHPIAASFRPFIEAEELQALYAVCLSSFCAIALL